MKPIEWMRGSYKDIKALSDDVQKFFGYALFIAQSGGKHEKAKVFKGYLAAACLRW